MAFCCFVGGSVLAYPRHFNRRLSSMLCDRSWRGSSRRFALKTSSTLSTASWNVSLARSFSLLRENSLSQMVWAKAPRSQNWSSCVNLSRNSSCYRLMRVRNLIQRIHAWSNLTFVLDVLALSRASGADESLLMRSLWAEVEIS